MRKRSRSEESHLSPL